jgi:proteasome lid subunit RPN8/RPN11
MLTEKQRSVIQAHAIEQYTRDKSECCGFVLKDGSVLQAKNIAADRTNSFSTDKYTTSLAFRSGIAYIYHSHTDGTSGFSYNDAVGCLKLDIPFVLYDVYASKFKILDPSGNTDYIGRDFCWLINDCYSLICDYYLREFGITLGKYDREIDEHGNLTNGNDFLKHYAKEDFTRVDAEAHLQRGDVLVFAIGSSNPNHIGVMDQDGLFLHQLKDQLSKLEVWGNSWKDCTVAVLRHQKSNSLFSYASKTN